MDGRILAAGSDRGAGFCVTDRVVVTAAHVIRGAAPADLAFVTDGGVELLVESVEIGQTADLAMLRLAESVAAFSPLAHVTPRADWRVTCRPEPHDSQLSGTVTAVDHEIFNADGHWVSVLQLHVNEILADYTGYSGSAVIVDGAVVGVLVEQVRERLDDGSRFPRAANVLYAVPIAAVIECFQLGVVVQNRQVGLPRTQQFLDTAYFDLDRLKSAILDAQAHADRRLLGFAVEAPESVVVRKLCDWLPQYLGDLDCKDYLNLRPDLTSLDAAVNAVRRYYADLTRVAVVCPVLVDGVSAARLDEFWRAVVDGCGTPQRWFVLIFAFTALAEVPQGVVALPPPTFGRPEILTWTRLMVASRKWSPTLAAAWADAIVEESSDGGQLNVRYTYENLQDGIRRIRTEPDVLRRDLEERRARGDASSR